MVRKKQKKVYALDYTLRQEADWIVQVVEANYALTVRQIMLAVAPLMRADPRYGPGKKDDDYSFCIYYSRYRNLCNRLVELGELEVDDTMKPYYYNVKVEEL